MKWLNFLIKSLFYGIKQIVIMRLDNVLINVFVINVIKIKVILIYLNVLFVEHKYLILYIYTYSSMRNSIVIIILI